MFHCGGTYWYNAVYIFIIVITNIQIRLVKNLVFPTEQKREKKKKWRQYIHVNCLFDYLQVFFPRFENYEHFNFEHVLFVKLKQTKIRAFYKQNFMDFQNSNFVIGKFLKIRSSINLSWGHARSHKKNVCSSVQPCWRFMDTNRQTKYIYIFNIVISVCLPWCLSVCLFVRS